MNLPDPAQFPLTTLKIPSVLDYIREPEEAIVKEAGRHGYCEEDIFAIKLTLEEALTNAIKHGNKCDADKKVIVRYFVDDQQIVIYVRNEGEGFEPDEVPDPTSPDRLSLPSGRGILLMRAYMDEVEYREGGRELYLRKCKRE